MILRWSASCVTLPSIIAFLGVVPSALCRYSSSVRYAIQPTIFTWIRGIRSMLVSLNISFFSHPCIRMFLQRVRDMPLLLRRMVGELMDPQRAIPLVHRTRILFFVRHSKSSGAYTSHSDQNLTPQNSVFFFLFLFFFPYLSFVASNQFFLDT